MFFVLLSCDSLIILSNHCSFVKHFFVFLNSVLSSLSCDSLFILSKCFSFVKNFFVLFCISVLRQKKAQGVGFEPTRPCGQTVFKTASLWPLRYLSIFVRLQCVAVLTFQPSASNAALQVYHCNHSFVKHFFPFFGNICRNVINSNHYCPILRFGTAFKSKPLRVPAMYS